MPQYRCLMRHEIEPGMKVDVWFGSHGQGGVVHEITPDELVIDSPCERLTYPWSKIATVQIEVEVPLEDCIEYDPDLCRGKVEYFGFSGPFGMSGPLRCEYHVEKRIDRRENSIEMWADSDVPPPGIAHEDW